MYYIYKNSYGLVVVSNKEPSDRPFLITESFPEGNGKLCTDFETFWFEPYKENVITPTLDPTIKVLSDRQEFLEDCIAEMSVKVYSE